MSVAMSRSSGGSTTNVDFNHDDLDLGVAVCLTRTEADI